MRALLILVFLGFTLQIASAEPAKKTPPVRTREDRLATPRAPIIGQPFDDGEVIRYLEAEGRKLFKAGKVKPIITAARRCSLRLPDQPTEKISLPEAAKRAEAATVVLGEFFRDKEKVAFSSAAGGFFVSESGAMVTSLHVLQEKDSRGFVALLRDGRVFPVLEALAADPVEDLVVLQLEVPEGSRLTALPLAAEPAPMGAPVAVMSHPEEHFYLVTAGIVGRHTVWREAKGEVHFMTVSADFAKGSSGCPIFDERGVVVGVVNNTESIYYDDNGKHRQTDLQMVVKNATPSWVLRHLVGD